MNSTTAVFLFAVTLFSLTWESLPQNKATPQTKSRHTNYQSDILPLLKTDCTPCHFPGGKVYEKYPFDDYSTVAALGLKLNTRLKGKDATLVKGWVGSGKAEK